MTYHVKMLGASDMPMANHPWSEREINQEVRFPPKPKPVHISKGDELLYYAVGGYKRVFASARVEAPPALNDVHENPVIAKRWPYASPVSLRPEVKLEYVSSGPLLADIGPGLQEQVGHGVSDFEIGRPQFEKALDLLRKAKVEETRKLKTGWRP